MVPSRPTSLGRSERIEAEVERHPGHGVPGEPHDSGRSAARGGPRQAPLQRVEQRCRALGACPAGATRPTASAIARPSRPSGASRKTGRRGHRAGRRATARSVCPGGFGRWSPEHPQVFLHRRQPGQRGRRPGSLAGPWGLVAGGAPTRRATRGVGRRRVGGRRTVGRRGRAGTPFGLDRLPRRPCRPGAGARHQRHAEGRLAGSVRMGERRVAVASPSRCTAAEAASARREARRAHGRPRGAKRRCPVSVRASASPRP